MSFSKIYGQDRAIGLLKKQLHNGRTPHAYLFVGPEGVGKRTIALELAKTLNCTENSPPCDQSQGDQCSSCNKIDKGLHPDVQIVDFFWQAKVLAGKPEKQNKIKIDTIRILQKEISLKPFEGKYRISIIDPAEKLNIESANCLLKTLEEPPKNSVIILITTIKESLPQTVISRCQEIKFCRLSEKVITQVLNEKCGKDSLDEETLQNIAKLSDGHLSKAISFKESLRDTDNILNLIDFWDRLKNNKVDIAKLMDMSNQINKNKSKVEEFISNLVVLIEKELIKNPKHKDLAEDLLRYKRALRYNVNLDILMDTLLLKLGRTFRPQGSQSLRN